LAREKGHPEGSALIGYTLIAPLDANGRIDLDLWQKHHALFYFVQTNQTISAIWCASPAELGQLDTISAEI
jgi:hypothetical protein